MTLKDAPGLVCHADWSTDPGKRWLCIAERRGNTYRILAPEPADSVSTLLSRLRDRAGDRPVLFGIDCPIGVPLAYAEAAGIDDFAGWLPKLGQNEWVDFFRVAREPEEISLHRPFYPYNSVKPRSRAELIEALGMSAPDELLRCCERKTPARSAASSLFWTLGAKQVGRAAISAWQDLLQPAIRSRPRALRVWPFEGALDRLLAPGITVIAETYPAESGLHIGLPPTGRRWSKQRSSDRAERGAEIRDWARRRNVRLTDALVDRLNDGFGDGKAGEDAFDSLVGVAGMLEVVLGHRPDMPDMEDAERRIEGWIFGQA